MHFDIRFSISVRHFFWLNKVIKTWRYKSVYIKTTAEKLTTTPKVHFRQIHPITNLKILKMCVEAKDYGVEKTDNTKCSLNQFTMTLSFVHEFNSKAFWICYHDGGSWVLLYLDLSAMPKWCTKHDFSKTKLK